MYAEPVNVIEEKTLKGTVNVISKCEDREKVTTRWNLNGLKST